MIPFRENVPARAYPPYLETISVMKKWYPGRDTRGVMQYRLMVDCVAIVNRVNAVVDFVTTANDIFL
jgi:hypothetical protein